MAKRLRATVADYMVIAISPALIMALVGSLVLFLIELFYQGQYQARMQYVFTLFVFAAVLIGRISIEEGRERALGFSLVLGVAVLLVLTRFAEYSGLFARLSLVINIALIFVILWCSNKLTWDCTVVDEQEDASGEGLLQTMGIDEEATSVAPDVDLHGTSGGEPAEPKAQPRSLWQRFVEARRKKHAPGVWVVYFSMAALPIFGVGQGFIFNQDLADRRFVFKLLVVYVAAALGLLVTTSFLGLRRYLRQRRLEMPPQMAGVWLGVGAVMIVALLLFCMALPRRNAEYSVTHIPALARSPTDLVPNRWGFGNDGPEDENAQRQVKRDDSEQESNQTGEKQKEGKNGSDGEKSGGKEKSDSQSSGNKQSEQGKSGQKSQGNDKQSGKNKQDKQTGNSQSDQTKGKQNQSPGKQNQPPGKQNQEAGKDRRNKSDERQDDSERMQDERERNPGERAESDQRKRESAAERKSGEQKQPESQQETEDNQSRKQTAQRQSQSKFDPAKLVQQIGGGIGMLLKLLYWLIAILMVAWFVWRYWDQVREAVGNFIQAMKEFWARLWGGKAEEVEESAPESIDTGPPPRPFSDFPDPFQTDLHARLSVEQLVAYSFEAFEAWARERGYGRGPEQTPHEFASVVGRAAAPISQDAMRLAELYNRSAYSDDSLPPASLDYVRRFWAQLTAVNG